MHYVVVDWVLVGLELITCQLTCVTRLLELRDGFQVLRTRMGKG